MRMLIIVGAGGHGMEAAWVAEEMNATLPTDLQWSIAGLADDDSGKMGQRIYGYPILGVPEQAAQQFRREKVWYHCAIGDNAAREQMVP